MLLRRFTGTLASGQTTLWIVVRQFASNGDDWTSGSILLCGAWLQQRLRRTRATRLGIAGTGDTVATATWSIAPEASIDQKTNDDTAAYCRVFGLQTGKLYTLTCHLVGASGQEWDRSCIIECVEMQMLFLKPGVRITLYPVFSP